MPKKPTSVAFAVEAEMSPTSKKATLARAGHDAADRPNARATSAGRPTAPSTRSTASLGEKVHESTAGEIAIGTRTAEMQANASNTVRPVPAKIDHFPTCSAIGTVEY